MNPQLRAILLVLTLGAVVGLILYFESEKTQPRSRTENSQITILNKTDKAKTYEPAKEISSPDGFINAKAITIRELIGKKIILVDFWTYSCINCQRTIPYLRAWYDKYRDQGLEIIGIHTPEFEFEKDYGNVQAAVKKFGITYPVVLDNDYSTWRDYKNQYWPRKYLIDIDGYIVYDHIGEGGYEETETMIRKLLAERAAALGEEKKLADDDMAKPEGVESVDPRQNLTPEIYFGAFRNANLGNGKSGELLEQNFTRPAKREQNKFYLSGRWNITVESAKNQSTNARITLPYRARKVFLVAGSPDKHKIRIYQDGRFLKDVEITDEGLYRLIEDDGYGEHLLEIIIDRPGLQVFTLTFG